MPSKMINGLNYHPPRTATYVVAASDAPAHVKAQADYVCDGVADDVEIQAALNALPATGGCIMLLDGTYTLTAQIARAIDDIEIRGCGHATLLNWNNVNPVITAGARDGWLFSHFSTDAGGVDIATATESAIRSVWIAGIRTDDPVLSVISALTNQTWSGLSTKLTAGENLTIGQACYMKNDGKMWKSLATVAATMPVIALATAGIAANDTGEFLLIGFFREDAVFTFTVGDMLYASEDAAGALKNAAPTTAGEQVQVCGKCFPSIHVVYFNPSLELVEVA